MGDHSETIEIHFDPYLIGYDELIDVFWKNHNSLRQDRSRQYQSILFYHNEEQKEKAQSKKVEWERLLQGKIHTEIQEYSKFFLAEDYHQKYYLKRYKTAYQTLRDHYISDRDFVQSTLTARLNGFVKGYGTWQGIKAETQNWGLDPLDQKALIEMLNSLRW